MPISGDLKVGGSYQLEGQAGGTVLTCDPPKNFTATWEFGGGVSWIDVSVSSDGPDRARLVIEHIAHVDDHWDQFGPGAVGMGWDSMVLGLALHLRHRRGYRPVVRAAVDCHRGRSPLPRAVWRGVVRGARGVRRGSRDRRVRRRIGASRLTSARSKLEHVLASAGRPAISSTRCMTRHLSRLRG